MKTKLLLALFSLSAAVVIAQTNVSGGVYANTTWTKVNSPYIVTDTIVVFSNVTLTIEPGVVVKFADDKRLEIRLGALIAEGTTTDSITFTSNSGSPHPGIWGGIWLNQDTSSRFNYCNFHFADYAITQYVTRNILYKNSVFSNNNIGLGAVENAGLNSLIDNCNFTNNTNSGIASLDRVTVTNCSFSYNPIAIDNDTHNGNKYINCVFDNNSIGILELMESEVNNCIIKNGSKGIVCGGQNLIRNTLVDSNSIIGIHCGVMDTITNCRITNNGTGLDIYTHETINQNIIENNTTGMMITYTNNYVYCNKICNNSSYNLYYDVTGNNSSFASNYWCSTDSAAIAATIQDGYDNINLSLANFTPFDTTQCYQHSCSAYFALYPDNNVLHSYHIVNMANGTGTLTYVWSWGDGSDDSVAYPSHTYATGGLYPICLTITDSIGCTSYYCSNFSLQHTTNTIITVNVIPQNATGISESSIQKPTFLIFPNPATNSVNISIDETMVGGTLIITDITGRKMTGIKLPTLNCLLPTDFPSGIYFVTISNGEQALTRKLVIEK